MKTAPSSSPGVRGPVCCLLGTLLALAGCSATTPTYNHPHLSVFRADPAIVMDGDISEWPSGTAVLADDEYLYFRVKIEGETRTLQGMETPLALWLDTDADDSTGQVPDAPSQAATLGTDLEIEFSPRADRSGQGRGVAVHRVTPDGSRVRIPHSQSGIMFLPSYAAEWYEVRISRRIEGVPGLDAPGRTRGMFILKDNTGNIEGWSDPFTIQRPQLAPRQARADDTIPEKPEGALRVVSYNVLNNGPARNPEVFSRILQALNPDVILFQEWYEGEAPELAAWMTARVPTGNSWRAIRSEGSGVAIVSRHPLAQLGPAGITVPGEARPVRVVSATIYTPHGQFAVASTHLKCCGSKGSPEDALRISEAQAINEMMRSALSESTIAARVIGGDMNLVGTSPPLEIMSMALDADGSSLETASPRVIGDASYHTWRDGTSEFSPARLDYLLVGEAGVEILQEFALDTSLLSDKALARIGLDRTDSAVSDHLPVVADIRIRK